MSKVSKEELWERHGSILRDPIEIFGTTFDSAGITDHSLLFEQSASFGALLQSLGITLLVSREYENLLVALSPHKKEVSQTFFHLPHPSGIAVDPKNKRVYVAATRNPNQIIEFKPIVGGLSRLGLKPQKRRSFLMPSRAKYFAGANYFHDLAFIGKKLFANSVGQNAVVEIGFDSDEASKIVWWPACIEKNSKPDFRANYLQLNSIAAGKTLSSSYFSASGDRIKSTRPGDAAYPVDKEGVIFSGKSRRPVAGGLTRPHSARFYKKELLVDNSGYGQVGFIKKGEFVPIVTLPGWTRGLCVVKDVAFVGVSRILPRFRQYAPGIPKGSQEVCGVYAVDLKTHKVLGSVLFPYGNQIFAVESISTSVADGFLYRDLAGSEDDKNAFLTYQL